MYVRYYILTYYDPKFYYNCNIVKQAHYNNNKTDCYNILKYRDGK